MTGRDGTARRPASAQRNGRRRDLRERRNAGGDPSGISGRDAAITSSMFELGTLTTTLIGFAAALPLAAAGIGVLRTHVMPNWLGYLALLAAVVSFLGAFGVFATSGAFVAGGWLMSTVPLLLSAIWVLAASGYMVREHVPEITTGDAAVLQM
ncbi:hypothetical protein [Kribbella sp. NPDC004536]|uniref:hypothetical protein n=1 Tax=Kribbella sp. NPDC004536 TaxID=3364106 RepID=UPI003679EDBB